MSGDLHLAAFFPPVVTGTIIAITGVRSRFVCVASGVILLTSLSAVLLNMFFNGAPHDTQDAVKAAKHAERLKASQR